LGANTVTFVATDRSGNTDTCISIVTILDNAAPNALCKDISIYLDAGGNASITPADVDGGSNDNCSITSIAATPLSFDCNDLGANSVTLTVADSSSNSSSCTSTVTVVDSTSPAALCQNFFNLP
jgi:hypothetical protein